MLVKDFFSKIPGSYVEIAVNEYKGNDHTGRRWVFKPYESAKGKLPDDVWNKEVSAIIPYYDRISVEIEA